MTKLVGKLAALMLISVLVTSVGATPAFADWDKTSYPAIQGTIPIADGQDFAELSNITLVDAMSTAEDAVPFYLLNLVPFVLADVIINKSKIKKSHYIAGAMIGSSFIFSYFPLITYTYNEVMFHRLVWPSMIPLIYSEFIVVIFPLLIACGAVSSVIGTLIAVKVSRRIIL